MKTITNITYPAVALFAFVCFALSQLADAQCPQICTELGNTALGDDALLNNSGVNNTAIGDSALFSNTTGTSNTATGSNALKSNTTGQHNTATGTGALVNNTTASDNTAIGGDALFFNNGSFNTAIGDDALFSNTIGDSNTATGADVLFHNETGSANTAHGVEALFTNKSGNDNTAIGFQALLKAGGSSNIALGKNAGLDLTSGSNNIYIGSDAISADEHRKIRIGTTGIQKATFIAGISGVTVPTGVGVIVGTDGKLGTLVSSERYKDDIKPMDKASDAILALKPVTFRYKHDFDPEAIPQFGLVAEEVEKVNPDLVARDEQGKPYTVRYEAVNAMLLNEFLKEHRKVEQQRKDFEATLAQQQKQIEALTAGLEKVAAQLELSKSAPQAALNNQ